MDQQLIQKIGQKFFQKKRDVFSPGDTVAVHSKIKEGDKTRVQVFSGVVLAMRGTGVTKTFTVRKISHGVGVEKVFPYHSPLVENVELIKKGKNKSSKLYYLRQKIGNKALLVKDGGEITESDVYVEEVPKKKKTAKKSKESVKEEAEKTDKKDTKPEEKSPESKNEEVSKKPTTEEKKQDSKPEEKSKKTDDSSKDSENPKK